MMQTTQKDSFFKITDSLTHGVVETGHFYSKSFWYELNSEILQKVWSFQQKFAFYQEKHFGWIFFILYVKYVKLFTGTYIDLNYLIIE